jgi:hypothetical protein
MAAFRALANPYEAPGYAKSAQEAEAEAKNPAYRPATEKALETGFFP